MQALFLTDTILASSRPEGAERIAVTRRIPRGPPSDGVGLSIGAPPERSRMVESLTSSPSRAVMGRPTSSTTRVRWRRVRVRS